MSKAELSTPTPEGDSPGFMEDLASFSLGGLAKADFLARHPNVSFSDSGQVVVRISKEEGEAIQAILDEQAAEAQAKGAN